MNSDSKVYHTCTCLPVHVSYEVTYSLIFRCFNHKWGWSARLYNYHITRNLANLLKTHKDKIFSPAANNGSSVEDSSDDLHTCNTVLNGFDYNEYSNEGRGRNATCQLNRDANGFSLDRSLHCLPDERALSARQIVDLDQHYTW